MELVPFNGQPRRHCMVRRFTCNCNRNLHLDPNFGKVRWFFLRSHVPQCDGRVCSRIPFAAMDFRKQGFCISKSSWFHPPVSLGNIWDLPGPYPGHRDSARLDSRSPPGLVHGQSIMEHSAGHWGCFYSVVFDRAVTATDTDPRSHRSLKVPTH